MKKSFKTYIQEQQQHHQQKLLDLVSQDPEESRKLAIRFLEKNVPVPEQLIQSVATSAGQSIRLADAYAQRKMQPPKDLLWTISYDPEYSFMLSTTYMQNNMQIPDVILNSVTQNAKSSIRFATSWHTHSKQDVPEPILKRIASNSYYAQQYKNFLETYNMPVPSLIEKSAKQDAKEENEEQDAFQNVQKYKDKLIRVISKDPDESMRLMQQMIKKGEVPPPVLFTTVMKHNDERVDSHFSQQLISLTDAFYEKDMQLPVNFGKYMTEKYPTVIVRNNISKNMPVSEAAMKSILKNAFQTASIISFLLKRNKEIPDQMVDALKKEPRTIAYVMGDVVKFINNNFVLRDLPFDSFMQTRFPKKLLKIIKQNPSVQKDIVQILKMYISEEIIKKYFSNEK